MCIASIFSQANLLLLLLIFHFSMIIIGSRQFYFSICIPMHGFHWFVNTLTALRSLLRLSLLVFRLTGLEVIDEDLTDVVHGVELRHASRLVLPDVHLLAHLILLDLFQSLFGHADVPFVRLGRLS